MIISQTNLVLQGVSYLPGAPVPLEAIPAGRLDRMIATGQLVRLEPIPAPSASDEEE